LGLNLQIRASIKMVLTPYKISWTDRLQRQSNEWRIRIRSLKTDVLVIRGLNAVRCLPWFKTKTVGHRVWHV